MTRPRRKRLRVYLAGPEVFLPGVRELAAEKKRLCARHGMVGVFPLDADIEAAGALSPGETARAIARANEGLIRGCDLVVANCTPFRGVSMDAGTAYEVGYARALGKTVLGYSNVVADYAARARRYRVARPRAGDDPRGSEIEDFGLAENLMIAMATGESGCDVVRTRVPRGRLFTDLAGFERCLGLARDLLRGRRARPADRA